VCCPYYYVDLGELISYDANDHTARVRVDGKILAVEACKVFNSRRQANEVCVEFNKGYKELYFEVLNKIRSCE
jgi:hypothetical protein